MGMVNASIQESGFTEKRLYNVFLASAALVLFNFQVHKHIGVSLVPQMQYKYLQCIFDIPPPTMK